MLEFALNLVAEVFDQNPRGLRSDDSLQWVMSQKAYS